MINSQGDSTVNQTRKDWITAANALNESIRNGSYDHKKYRNQVNAFSKYVRALESEKGTSKDKEN